MKSYRVVWAIDVDADTPENAARVALSIQRDRDSLALQFDVYGDHGYRGVDLLDDEFDEFLKGDGDGLD